jgi:hypothetical protein
MRRSRATVGSGLFFGTGFGFAGLLAESNTGITRYLNNVFLVAEAEKLHEPPCAYKGSGTVHSGTVNARPYYLMCSRINLDTGLGFVSARAPSL